MGIGDIEAAELEFDVFISRRDWNTLHPGTLEMLKESYLSGFHFGLGEAPRLRRMLSGLEDGFLDVCAQRDVAKTELRLLKKEDQDA